MQAWPENTPRAWLAAALRRLAILKMSGTSLPDKRSVLGRASTCPWTLH